MRKVLLHTPFLVEMELEEIDDIPEMLSVWKNNFLSGSILELWNKLEKREKLSGTDNKALRLSRAFLKWLWPILVLSVTAYIEIWSALFLSVILLPIQVIMIVYLFLKLYTIVCVYSAFNLENSSNKSPLP
jgi:hypothetical protein